MVQAGGGSLVLPIRSAFPPGESGDLDGHHRTLRGLLPVLTVFRRQQDVRPLRFRCLLHDPGGACGSDPPQPIPSLRVAVGPFFAPVGNDALRQASKVLPQLLVVELSHQSNFQLFLARGKPTFGTCKTFET